MMKLRFNWLSGDVSWLSYGKWISKRLNNGDWDYWLVIELTNMEDACGRDNEGQPKYHVCVSAVSPTAAQSELVKAFESHGLTDEEVKRNPIVQVECLHSYGVHAVLWQDSTDNAHKGLKEARKQAMQSEFLFGFAMDRYQNRVGATGWDTIAGNLWPSKEVES